jgi:hypothetical protein
MTPTEYQALLEPTSERETVSAVKLDDYTESDLDALRTLRSKALAARASAVSNARSRRMRGLATDPLPPIPPKILVPCAYDAEGNWEGRLYSTDDAGAGQVVKWEQMH